MQRWITIFSFSMLFAATTSSIAAPIWSPQISGSTFFLYVTNPDSVRYSCNISYTLTYTEYGNPGSLSSKAVSTFGPHVRGYVAVKNETTKQDLNYQNLSEKCFPGPTPPSQNPQPPPGVNWPVPHGSYENKNVCPRRYTVGAILHADCQGNNHPTLDLHACPNGPISYIKGGLKCGNW